MDGRVYDPAIGRFLSPDNYVQLSENSQSFNRYSYCINNPLKYTDPTGQFFQIGFIGAALLAADAFANAMTTDSGSKFFISSAISIFSPAVSGAIGGIFGHSAGSFGKELLRAGAHGLASGVANALTGENFGAGFASGALASFAGSGAQWAGLGKGGVLGATTLFGGIGSASFGGDFLQGAMTGLNIGLYNHTWVENGVKYNNDNPNDITGDIIDGPVATGRKPMMMRVGEVFNKISLAVGSYKYISENAGRDKKGWIHYRQLNGKLSPSAKPLPQIPYAKGLGIGFDVVTQIPNVIGTYNAYMRDPYTHSPREVFRAATVATGSVIGGAWGSSVGVEWGALVGSLSGNAACSVAGGMAGGLVGSYAGSSAGGYIAGSIFDVFF